MKLEDKTLEYWMKNVESGLCYLETFAKMMKGRKILQLLLNSFIVK